MARVPLFRDGRLCDFISLPPSDALKTWVTHRPSQLQGVPSMETTLFLLSGGRWLAVEAQADDCLAGWISPAQAFDWFRKSAIEYPEELIAAVSGSQEQPPGEAHSVDFRSVNWFGTPYVFTPAQAACVKIWWEHWEKGAPEIGDPTVLTLADVAGNRIDALFRGCAAWGTMIVPGSTKGTHRLQAPRI